MASRKAGLSFIVVTLFLDCLGIGLVVPILPRLVESFVGNDATKGAFCVGVLAVGLRADAVHLLAHHGQPVGSLRPQRPVLLLSLFGSAFDYVLLAFAPIARVVLPGPGGVGHRRRVHRHRGRRTSPTSARPEKRAQNFGLIGMAFGLGFVAGPLLSAFLGAVELPLPRLHRRADRLRRRCRACAFPSWWPPA